VSAREDDPPFDLVERAREAVREWRADSGPAASVHDLIDLTEALATAVARHRRAELRAEVLSCSDAEFLAESEGKTSAHTVLATCDYEDCCDDVYLGGFCRFHAADAALSSLDPSERAQVMRLHHNFGDAILAVMRAQSQDMLGGYARGELLAAFQHGMATMIRVVEEEGS
jgi:hypothetical protein